MQYIYKVTSLKGLEYWAEPCVLYKVPLTPPPTHTDSQSSPTCSTHMIILEACHLVFLLYMVAVMQYVERVHLIPFLAFR